MSRRGAVFRRPYVRHRHRITSPPAPTVPINVADTLTITDTATVGIPIGASDSATISDQATIAASVTGADAVTLSDTATVAGSPAVADAVALTDSVLVGPKATDTLTVSELASLVGQVGLSDSVSISDGVSVETLFGDVVIALWGVDPDTGDLVALPDATQLTLSRERNGAGSISLTYPVDGLNFALLRDTITADRDLEVEIWTIGSPAGALRGYLQEASGDDVSEDRSWQFAGGFCELRLAEALVWNQEIITTTTVTITTKLAENSYEIEKTVTVSSPSQGSHSTTTTTTASEGTEGTTTQTEKTKGELDFVSVTPGELVGYILDQAQARGTLTDITRGFTDDEDANGDPWPQVISTKFSPGSSYDQILARLIDFGLVEWAVTWTGTEKRLDLWIPAGRGVDLTTGARPIVLRKARNLLDAPRKWSVRDSGTTVLAAGADGVYEDITDVDSVSRRGRRIEVAASANNLDEPAAVEAYAQQQLELVKAGLLEVTHGIGFLPGEPRPLSAFDIGDWVYSQTRPDVLERLRVVQWTLSADADRNPSGTVTLNDTVTDALTRLQSRLTALASGDTVVGTSSSSTAPDTGVPQAPTGVVAGSTAYLVNGEAHSLVSVSWEPVQLNTDGTACTDLAGYQVQYAYAAAPTEWLIGADVTDNFTAATFDASPGVEITIRVAAYDVVTDTKPRYWSEWSTPVTIVTEDDTTPPGIPSTPTVSEFLGTVRINWDGNTSTGADMYAAYPDFDHVEVHLSTGSLFTPSASTQAGVMYAHQTHTVTDLPYDVTQYARLVAVDRTGNKSSASAQASATPGQVVSADVFDGAIGSAKLADLAVVTAKIANLAVNNAKIADLSVGKLTSGTVTADMLLSSAIYTATTGARAQLDSSGLRLWNASNVNTVNLSAVTGSALITGQIQTALSGTSRIVMNPGGTNPDRIDLYPNSGTTFGSIESSVVSGEAAVSIFGNRDSSSSASGGMALIRRSWAALYYGSRDYSYIGSEIYTDGTTARMNSPIVDVAVDTRTSAAGGNRFAMTMFDSNRNKIAATQLNYWATGTPEPWLAAVNQDAGLVFGSGIIYAVANSSTTKRNLFCDTLFYYTLTASSSRTTKRDIRPAVLDMRKALRRARPMWYRRNARDEHDLFSIVDEDHRQIQWAKEAPEEIGLIAEDMPDELQDMVRDTDGTRSPGIKMYDAFALLWGHVGDLTEELDEVRERLARYEAAA